MQSNDIYYHKYRKYKGKYLTLTNTQLGGNPNNLEMIGGQEKKVIFFNQHDIKNYGIFSHGAYSMQNRDHIRDITQGQLGTIFFKKKNLYEQLNGKAYNAKEGDDRVKLIEIEISAFKRLPSIFQKKPVITQSNIPFPPIYQQPIITKSEDEMMDDFFNIYDKTSDIGKGIFLNGAVDELLRDPTKLERMGPSLNKRKSSELDAKILQSKNGIIAPNEKSKYIKQSVELFSKYEKLSINKKTQILNYVIEDLILKEQAIPFISKKLFGQLYINLTTQFGGVSLPKEIYLNDKTIDFLTPEGINYLRIILNAIINPKITNYNKQLDTALIITDAGDGSTVDAIIW
jgi:hypothetical protein